MAKRITGGLKNPQKQAQPKKSKSKPNTTEKDSVKEKQTKKQPSKSIFNRDNRLSSLFSSQTESQSPRQTTFSSDDTDDDDLFNPKETSSKSKRRKLSTPITQFNHIDSDLDNELDNSSDDIFAAQAPKKKSKLNRKKASKPQNHETNQLRSPLQDNNEQELEPFRKLNHENNHSQSLSQSRSQSRRSSYYNRGRRVSSIGGFDGEPHQEVPSTSYHKYIDNSVPESDRMRQLLIWNLKADLDIYEKEMKSKQAEFQMEDHTVFNISRTIKEELISSLKDYSISIDWKDGDVNNSDILLPNPQNQTNLENIRIYSDKIEKLKREKIEWEEAYKKQGLPINDLNHHAKIDDVKVEQFSANLENQYYVLHESLKKTVPCVDKLYFSSYQMESATKLIELEKDQISKKVSNHINKFPITKQEPSTTKNLLKAICKLKAQ
ncbi:uncharacterized protein KGF55_004097 [Candida pseudojiufengensis]|uniref:uncharacterized protein n=1 Tax=Candida pseudojiufengensis TaxID=497109 RepID=UPI002224052E|nr:uncharacterized protein KGF55_004097 [Candida pseudojiufengensis]KAI5961172.1 hypothetical protein KGF55_004097 [Candida pseudojiufengensis]